LIIPVVSTVGYMIGLIDHRKKSVRHPSLFDHNARHL
jgi:hypothetical protein